MDNLTSDMCERAFDIWSRVLKILKFNISETDYSSWLLNVNPVSMDDKFLIIEVDNNFIKKKIESKFKNKIIEILNTVLVLEGYKDLKIVVNETLFEEIENELPQYSEMKKLNIFNNSVQEEEKEEANINKENRRINTYTDILTEKKEDRKANSYQSKPLNLFKGGYYNLNKRHVFTNYVVGKSNEFANAAAEAVANGPGKVYNPLFLYGGVGLGKTHLMHAIGNRILKNDSTKKIYYCSSEQFTNDLINSLKNDKMNEFRAKYRRLDILLIDDIQFIAGKDSTQEEFFHTFNELHQAGKQIVLSSDRPPKEFDNLEKRLASRFEWGLIADIKQPDYETRVAILKKKAEMDSIDVPEDVLRNIAEAVNSNIRELEGALNRIVARASLLKKEITVELVHEVFYDALKTKSKIITEDKILDVVSDYYGISLQEIKSRKRKKNIAGARQVAMYLIRDILQLPFVAIGGVFGGKDHTTVMHSVSKVEKELEENKFFTKEIATIRERIEN